MKWLFIILFAAALLAACTQQAASPDSARPAPSDAVVVPASEWDNAAQPLPSTPPPKPSDGAIPDAPAPPDDSSSASSHIQSSAASAQIPAPLPHAEFYPKWLAAMHSRNFVGAVVEATNAMGVQPDNSSLYALRSISYLAMGDTFHALPDAKKAVALAPSSAEALTALGHAHYALYLKAERNSADARGNYSAAESNYSKAAELSWHYAPAHGGLSMLYFSEGKNDLGALENSRAVTGNYSLRTPLSLFLVRSLRPSGPQGQPGMYPSYLFDYSGYVAVRNFFPSYQMPNLSVNVPLRDVGSSRTPDERAKFSAYAALGDAYAFNSNYTHAIYWFRQAKLADQFNQKIYAKMSLIYHAMDLGSLAKENADAALRLGGDDGLANYAAALSANGEADSAGYYAKAYEADPRSFGYCISLASAYQLTGLESKRDAQYDLCRNLLMSDYFPLFLYDAV